MKAFSDSARKRFDAAGLILLFDGEVAEAVDGFWLMVDGKGASATSRYQPSTFNHQPPQPDEHSQTGILTSDLTSFPPSGPSRIAGPDSGFGELVIRYSGATVPDSHGVPWHLTATNGGQLPAVFKERFLVTPRPANCQE